MILGASCSSPKPEPHGAPEFYDLSVYEEAKVGDILEVAEVVPLLFERDTYPKHATFLSFLDGNIVIEHLENSDHVFSSDGHYIGCSESMKGQGPGEHVMLLGHVVNPFSHTIDVLGISNMYSYDPEFTHSLRVSDLPTIVGTADKLLFDSGIALSETKYLLHSSIVTNPYQVTLYDAEQGKALNNWSYADDVVSFFNNAKQKFFRMPDGEILITAEGYSPYIYGVDSEGRDMYKAIEFKYGDKIITDHVTLDDFRKNHKIMEDYHSKSQELPMLQLVNSKKIITVIRDGLEYYEDRYVLLTDRESKKTYKMSTVENGEVVLPFFHAIDEDYLYNIVTKDFILENRSVLLNRIDEADSLLCNYDEDDRFLIKSRFKK
jgi:hypothetical protein